MSSFGYNLLGFGGGVAANIAVNAVHFDGSTYLSKASDFTGNADSKLITFSIWVKIGSIGSQQTLFSNAKCNINISAAGKFNFSFQDSTQIVLRSTTNSVTLSSGQWYHVAFSADLTDTGKRDLYIDGVDATPTWNDYVDSAIDFTQTTHTIGIDSGGSLFPYTGDMSEVYINFGEYVDLSVSANLAKFRTLTGKPAILGVDGSAPTGSAPILYNTIKSITPSDFAVNQGGGGGMTENGALTLSSTSPSY